MPRKNASHSRANGRAPKQLDVKHVLVALLFSLITATALGQITVPAESKEHTPIPVTLKAMVPDGAQIKSGAGLVWPDGVNKLEVGPGQWVVCAPPGEYTITYKVSWLHIQPVTFIDGSGKEITIQSYLGSGDIDEKATFKVLGGEPPVPPPPPPHPPGGPYQVVLFYSPDQLDNLTADQREILNSMAYREKLKAAGHTLLGVLPDNAAPSPQSKFRAFYNAVQGDSMPRLAVASKDGGKIVDMPLPATAEELDTLLKTEVLK